MFKFINNYFLSAASLLIFTGMHLHAPVSAQSDSTRLMSTLQLLCGEQANGRKPGTEGHLFARQYIEERFRSVGLAPIENSFLQTHTTQSGQKVINIHGMIKGQSERYILITAHYDHLGRQDDQVYYGCDDNASGVASMLEIAQFYSDYQPEHSLIFIAFDKEETGLLGSSYWVQHPPVPLDDIDLILNMDMLSKNDNFELFASGTAHHPQMRPTVEAAAERFSRLTVRFGHDRPNAKLDDWTLSSDHGPFYEAGVPHLYFGVEDHPHYHQPTDDFARIPFSFYWQVTNFLITTVELLDNALTNE